MRKISMKIIIHGQGISGVRPNMREKIQLGKYM